MAFIQKPYFWTFEKTAIATVYTDLCRVIYGRLQFTKLGPKNLKIPLQVRQPH